MVYRLCYIDENKAYFTSNWKEQWGDDWNDRPYEHNAGTPYRHYTDKNNVEHEIVLKECYFETPHTCKTPCYGVDNSPYSVNDINNRRCPWLIIDKYDDSTVYIFAGTTYTNFVKQIKSVGGKIFEIKK